MIITVDHVENFHYSAGDWRCDAFTLSEDYKSHDDGTVSRNGHDMKAIGSSGNYCWAFADQEHNEQLIRPYREYKRPKSEKGLTVQKAGKAYNCRHCERLISKGEEYERYTVRYAGKLGSIREVFCVGCRDKLRAQHFGKPCEEISFSEVKAAWDNGVLV